MRSRRQRARNPSLPAPATRAACITCDRPNAKSKSWPVSSSMTGTADMVLPFRFRNAPASFRRPSSVASEAWIRPATSPSRIAASTFVMPVMTVPALLASVKACTRSRQRAASICCASGLESAVEQAAPNGFGDHVGPCGDPDAPSGQAVLEIGHDSLVGPDHESNQLIRRADDAAHDAGALGLVTRHGQFLARPCVRPDALRYRPAPRP